MTCYTGKDRIRAVFKGEPVDRIPYYPMLGHFTAKLLPCSIAEYLTDSEKFAAAQLKAYALFKPDVVTLGADSVIEAEALGSKVRFDEGHMPVIVEHFLEEKKRLHELALPDPTRSGRMPYYLDASRKVAAAIKESAVGSGIAGPWTIAVGLRGAETLLRDCMKDAPFVHSLMAFTSEVVQSFALEVRKTGVGVSLVEPPASCSLISPKIYREFVFPHHQRLVAGLKAHRINLTLHVCGYTDPILGDLVATGANAISIDAPTNLAKTLEVAAGRAVVIGNVDTRLFYTGSRTDLERAVRDCVEAGLPNGGYILATGCDMPSIATVDRVKWFMEAAETYGRCEKREGRGK